MTRLKHNPVWRLLRRNISAGQIAGYALANLVGLAIVVTALQFYSDVSAAWRSDGDDSFMQRDYLILSKHVEGLSFNGADANAFTRADIAEIEAQPWVKRVGEFTAAQFNVAASVEMGGRGMSSFLFLESIPDAFYDVRPEGWDSWVSPSQPVPIIISKDYLTLYNFGFASSRGLPQISESLIGAIPLRLSLSGNGHQQYIDARIVGFSNRLNTIAVPGNFMKWANERFAEEPPSAPSRIIVEVSKPGDPQINEYLGAHGLEAAGDKIDNSRATRFLTIVTAAVVAVGAVISLLALFILLLSIYLLLQKNRRKTRYLILLGYTPGAIATHYYIIVALVNTLVLLLSIAVLLGARSLWRAPLEQLGISATSMLPAILTAFGAIMTVTAINILAIRRSIRRSTLA